ncbi:hypothetical protein ACQKWADRAFT_279652, partial [Trichoderma austrokoningii]
MAFSFSLFISSLLILFSLCATQLMIIPLCVLYDYASALSASTLCLFFSFPLSTT